MNGPTRYHRPCFRDRFFMVRYMKTLTNVIRLRVMPKDIQWPISRATALTVPLMIPTTSAGQHHAPMSAGIENSSVMTDTIIVRRSACFVLGDVTSGVAMSMPSAISGVVFVTLLSEMARCWCTGAEDAGAASGAPASDVPHSTHSSSSANHPSCT